MCKEETLLIDKNEFFSKIKEKTRERELCSSPYLRLVELLYFFSINISDFFVKYRLLGGKNGDDLKDIKKYFLYDLLRHHTNYNAVKNFYDTLASVLKDREFSYNGSINSLMHEMEQKIIDDLEAKIITNYNDYKSFFIHFLKKFNSLIDNDYNQSHQYYILDFLELYKYGISFQRDEFIWDIMKDKQSEEYSSILRVEDIINNLILEKIEEACENPDLKDKYASLYKNWDLFCKLYNNKELFNYFNSVIFPQVLNSKGLQELIKEIFNQIDQTDSITIIRRAIKYSYLLTYKEEQSTRVDAKTIRRFFEAQIKEDIFRVTSCVYRTSIYTIFNKKYLEILFCYACTLREGKSDLIM
ncbi:hypothetical protein AALB39_25715 [Lachnospiraceae bacterium 54-53]